VIPVDLDSLALLSQLAVVPRYPGWDEEDLDSEAIEQAVDAARKIYQAVSCHLADRGYK